MSKSAASGEDVRLASEQTEMHWPRETERGIFPSSGRERGATERAGERAAEATLLHYLPVSERRRPRPRAPFRLGILLPDLPSSMVLVIRPTFVLPLLTYWHAFARTGAQ